MHRALVALLLALLAAGPALAAPATAPQPVNQTVAYWTPERMAGAKSRQFVFAPGETRGRLVSEAAKATPTARRPKPTPKPTPTPTPPPSGIVTTSGASWNAGGLALAATGKVFFTMGTGNYVCSGAVVTDTRADLSLVLTAGHCAYDQATRTFATNWLFVPAYDATPNITGCSAALYGCWSASALVVHAGFADAGGFTASATRYDWAFAVVGAGGKSVTQLDATVGSFPLAIPGFTKGATSVSFGYPAASPYTGQDLVYCAGPIGEDVNNANATWSLACNMTGGSSGGPWMSAFTTDRGALSSVNSYRYSTQANMYGPKFNANTQSTYTSANSATLNTIVR